MTRHVRLERLVGRRVRDEDGRVVGHLHEVVARRQGRSLVVVEYQLGAYSRWPFTRRTLYRVPWQLLDVSDPTHPRLRCSHKALKPAA